MLPTCAEAFDDPLKAWIALFVHYREKRGARKEAEKTAQNEVEAKALGNSNSEFYLDEGNAAMQGQCPCASNDYAIGDSDPRFKKNLHGEGTSKAFESSPRSSTTECKDTPNSSPRLSGSTRATTLAEHDDTLSLPKEASALKHWVGPEVLDWTKEKRKGKAPEGGNESGSTEPDYKRWMKRSEKRTDSLRRGMVFAIMKHGFP